MEQDGEVYGRDPPQRQLRAHPARTGLGLSRRDVQGDQRILQRTVREIPGELWEGSASTSATAASNSSGTRTDAGAGLPMFLLAGEGGRREKRLEAVVGLRFRRWAEAVQVTAPKNATEYGYKEGNRGTGRNRRGRLYMGETGGIRVGKEMPKRGLEAFCLFPIRFCFQPVPHNILEVCSQFCHRSPLFREPGMRITERRFEVRVA